MFTRTMDVFNDDSSTGDQLLEDVEVNLAGTLFLYSTSCLDNQIVPTRQDVGAVLCIQESTQHLVSNSQDGPVADDASSGVGFDPGCDELLAVALDTNGVTTRQVVC